MAENSKNSDIWTHFDNYLIYSIQVKVKNLKTRKLTRKGVKGE